jgi:hypothetical protein
MIQPEGIENHGENGLSSECAAPGAARNLAATETTDPDLRELIDVWPDLPATLREAIKAMLRAAVGNRG